MSLFECVECGCVENTALSNFWTSRREDTPPLCSACDPEIGRWHGMFDRESAEDHESEWGDGSVAYRVRGT